MTTVEIGAALGSPENRLSMAQLRGKFLDCARNAVRAVADDAVEEAADIILNMQNIGNVGVLLHRFA